MNKTGFYPPVKNCVAEQRNNLPIRYSISENAKPLTFEVMKKVQDKARGSQAPLHALNTAPQRGSGTIWRGSRFGPRGHFGGLLWRKAPPLNASGGDRGGDDGLRSSKMR